MSRHSDFVADCMCFVRKCSCNPNRNQCLSSVFAVGFVPFRKLLLAAADRSPSPWGPHSAKRSRNLGHPSRGGVGNSLGRGEGNSDARNFDLRSWNFSLEVRCWGLDGSSSPGFSPGIRLRDRPDFHDLNSLI